MKKSIFVAGFAAVMVLVAAAQVGKNTDPPKPPAPPTPPVENTKDVPPPPPPPPPCDPPPPPEPPAPCEPPPPPEPPTIPVSISPLAGDPEIGEWFSDEYEAFLKRNPSVERVAWNHQHQVIIKLKSGKEEKYNLDDEKSLKAAEDKYGKLPEPPPPPPLAPEPPKPPKKKGHLTLS